MPCRPVEQAESTKGNNGVPWVGGSNAGGSGQGFDQGGRRRDPRGLQPAQQPRRHGHLVDPARVLRQPADLPNLVLAQAAADFATRVLGERERTCENCTKTQTTPASA